MNILIQLTLIVGHIFWWFWGSKRSQPLHTGSSITWDANQFEYYSETSITTLVEICVSNPHTRVSIITLYSIKCNLFAGLAKLSKANQVDDLSFERKIVHFIDARLSLPVRNGLYKINGMTVFW